jgi:hypothetical protein
MPRHPGKALFAIVAATMLWVVAGCGRQVDLDPRDVEAFAEYEEESACNRTNVSVELKIRNRGSASYELYLYSRSGGRRRVGTIYGFEKRLKILSRVELQLGGAFLVRQSSGLTIGTGEYVVPINLLQCDVGYLELGPTLQMSHYIGMDFYPNDEFKK